MHYTSKASSTLFAKLVLKKRPYSQIPLHYALIADASIANLRVNKAAYTKVLPIETYNAEVLSVILEKMRDKYNFASVHLML
jgi:hypothetical protein